MQSLEPLLFINLHTSHIFASVILMGTLIGSEAPGLVGKIGNLWVRSKALENGQWTMENDMSTEEFFFFILERSLNL